MICPYCMESLIAGATVCKSCQRDVALVLALQQANRDLEDRLHALEIKLRQSKAANVDLDTGIEADHPPPRPLTIVDVLTVYIALPILLLLSAHYLLVIKFDANLLWLRVASIALPAVFGLVLDRRSSPRVYVGLGLGIIVAVASVLGMSTLVHYVDGEPILPGNRVAWSETIEYVASISLSYLLGGLIARTLRPLSTHSARAGSRLTELATFLVRRLSRSSRGMPLEMRVQRMIKVIRITTSCVTAAGALYTGLHRLL